MKIFVHEKLFPFQNNFKSLNMPDSTVCETTRQLKDLQQGVSLMSNNKKVASKEKDEFMMNVQ